MACPTSTLHSAMVLIMRLAVEGVGMALPNHGCRGCLFCCFFFFWIPHDGRRNFKPASIYSELVGKILATALSM